MSGTLRPMSLGEILDRTIRIYRARFWVFFGLSAFPAAAMLGLQFLNVFWWKLQPPALIPILGVNFGVFLYWSGLYHCSLFFDLLAWPCLTLAASQACLGGRPGPRATISDCARRWKSWIGLALLVQFLVVLMAEFSGIGVFLGIAALADWLSKSNEEFMDEFLPPLMGAIILAGFAFSLWLGSLYLSAFPVWCNEELRLRGSLKRSRFLSKGSRWRITFARLAPVAMVAVLSLAAAAAIRFTASAVAQMLHHSMYYVAREVALTYLLFSGAISALLGPVFPISLTLLYYDQRIRKEGFDIEWMMRTAGMEQAPNDPVAAPAESAAGAVASVPVEESKA